MEIASSQDSESRFVSYVEGLVSVIGHADPSLRCPISCMRSRRGFL
jgi:hypothetical protein